VAIGFIVVVAFMAVCLGLTVYRQRRGGPGPQTDHVPRALRPRVNAYYRSRGWQEPYDANGDRDPDRSEF
jgi:hypothetical protein